MNKDVHKTLEYIFLLSILCISGYLMWKLFYPFLGAVALAAIVATICFPLYERIQKHVPKKNASASALIAIVLVVTIIVLPLVLLASFILKEAVSIYDIFNSTEHITAVESLEKIEGVVQTFIPSFSLDVANVARQSAGFIADNIINIFAGTASTIFLLFIALMALYYFFRDGKYFTTELMKLSPLRDVDDLHIMKRLATAVRSVALGTVSIAMLQGVLTAFGLSLFGFDRAILWGCVAAIGAMIPGIGTTVVFVPAVVYLIYTGAHVPAIILGIWGVLAVGLIDNIIGPYVLSRGNNVHPFMMLLSVLGGIALFGPIGFILGPVISSLFLVLVEIYHAHTKKGTT